MGEVNDSYVCILYVFSVIVWQIYEIFSSNDINDNLCYT